MKADLALKKTLSTVRVQWGLSAPVLEISAEEIERGSLSPGVGQVISSPDEKKIYAPVKLRDYIKLLVATASGI